MSNLSPYRTTILNKLARYKVGGMKGSPWTFPAFLLQVMIQHSATKWHEHQWLQQIIKKQMYA